VRDRFEHEIGRASERAKRRRAQQPHALAARYDGEQGRIVIDLSTGYAVTFAPERAQGLAGARPADLVDIEITPSGYGLHFPKLDADLWLPALTESVFGIKRAVRKPTRAAEGPTRSPSNHTSTRKVRRLSKRRAQRAPRRG
jgi:hypothetical protein